MYKRALCLALLACIAGAANGLAQVPQKPSSEELPMRRALVQAVALATVPESEANDDYTTADAVNLGDQATGVIDPAGDWDWFSFTATAGQIIEIDVDASQVGSDLDPIIDLYASDGATELAHNDDWDGLDSRIEYVVETTGTHYLVITEYSTYWGSDQGGSTYTYTINFNVLEPGPGDPTTTLIANLRCVEGWAVADDGTIFVGDPCYNSIYTIEPDGTGADFATDLVNPGPMTFDAFGNLIVIDYYDGNVFKIAMDGTSDTFAIGYYPGWVETAPDGSIWIGQGGGGRGAPRSAEVATLAPGAAVAYQFDPLGNLVDTLTVDGVWFGMVEFSPDGYLHFTTGDTIWKVVDGTAQPVIGGECCMGDMVFDANGNIYVTQTGVVALYAADGTLLDDTFSLTVNDPWRIIFGRDADGSPNTQLYVTDWQDGGVTVSSPAQVPSDGSTAIVKLNAAGVETPGAQVGLSVDLMSDDDVAEALMGDPDAVTDGEKEFLDFMGNQNGQFDVGDLRAYLIYIGVLPEN
jgi:hypothetical protein